MIDRRKKYKVTTTNGYPHCGQLIQNYMATHQISKAFIARKLDVAPSTVNAYFRNQSLQIGIIWKISQILEHNFIAEIAEMMHIEHSNAITEDLKKQLAEKDNSIQKLEMKVEVYKEINAQ